MKTMILNEKTFIFLTNVLEVHFLISGKVLELCDNWTFINAISSYSDIEEACGAKMKMEDPWRVEKKYSSR